MMSGLSLRGEDMAIAILGGGMLGCCAALELAARGLRVVLVEAGAELLRGAAWANEGKLHFGHVYPRDTSLATARLMLRGALHAGPALRRLLGGAEVEKFRHGNPFRYAVHRDSLSSAEAVAGHYAACAALAREELGGRPADCFGADPREPTRRVPVTDDCEPMMIRALFQSPELSLDNRAIASALCAVVMAEPRIEVLLGRRATAARLAPDAVEVDLRAPDGAVQQRRFDHVINATWRSRLALDATVGLAPPPEWVFRLKFLVRLQAARAGIPNTSICVGPFGDVTAAMGRLMLSWYPVARLAASNDITPPEDWPTQLEGDAAQALALRVVEGLGALFPPLLALRDDPALAAAEVSGGVIYAEGGGDVHEPGSGLHARSRIGRRSLGRWHSIDPGKWTTCPLFATEVADHIAPASRQAA